MKIVTSKIDITIIDGITISVTALNVNDLDTSAKTTEYQWWQQSRLKLLQINLLGKFLGPAFQWPLSFWAFSDSCPLVFCWFCDSFNDVIPIHSPFAYLTWGLFLYLPWQFRSEIIFVTTLVCDKHKLTQ